MRARIGANRFHFFLLVARAKCELEENFSIMVASIVDTSLFFQMPNIKYTVNDKYLSILNIKLLYFK